MTLVEKLRELVRSGQLTRSGLAHLLELEITSHVQSADAKKRLIAFLRGRIPGAELEAIEAEPLYYFPLHLKAFRLWMASGPEL